MPKAKIYNVFKKDITVSIGSYTAAEAEKEFGIPKRQVAIYAKNEWRYQGQYSFLPEDKPVREPIEARPIKKSLADDWDFTVRALRLMCERR